MLLHVLMHWKTSLTGTVLGTPILWDAFHKACGASSWRQAGLAVAVFLLGAIAKDPGTPIVQ